MAGIRARFRKLEFLTLDQRIEVIRLSQQGLSQRGLAKKFKCGKTQIQNTLANKERFIAEWQGSEHNTQYEYKRRRGQPNESVNNLVLRWYLWASQNNVAVTGPALQEKAREYAAELNVESFSASNGWLECFRRRHNIRFTKRSAAADNLEGDSFFYVFPRIACETG
ncbi:hypothetical protein R5R35_003256 [Gryllus longicercus]|uniref:HTH CENPB-type domain-containing protein n=1 Tax=Gryllus longicercus TaxID=2509291 RepID=A0AAN9Z6F1_9ORTH